MKEAKGWVYDLGLRADAALCTMGVGVRPWVESGCRPLHDEGGKGVGERPQAESGCRSLYDEGG